MRGRGTEVAFDPEVRTVSADRRLAGMTSCLVAIWAITVALREEACAQPSPAMTNSISSPEPALEPRPDGI